MDEFRRLYRDDMLERFQATKGLADRALAQVVDTDFFRQIDEESTSLAQMVTWAATYVPDSRTG